MEEIQVESANNKGDKASSKYSSPLDEIYSVRNRLQIIEFCPLWSNGKPLTTQVITKGIGFSPQTDGKTLLLKTVYISQ